MQTKRVVLRVIVAIPIVVLGIFVARGGRASEGSSDEDRAVSAPVVRVGYAEEPHIVRIVRYPGVVASSDEAYVGALTAGRIETVNAEVGQRVADGEVLATIDAEGYQLSLANAEADRVRSRVYLDQARRELDRVRLLGSAATREELEQRTATFDAAVAQLARAETSVAEAERQIRETQVRAPRAGVVTEVLVDRGEVVNSGEPVAVVSTDGEIREIELGLPLQHTRGISIGDRATVRSTSDQNEVCLATIVSISEYGRSVDSLFPVRLSIAGDEGKTIPPGAPVSVELSIVESFGTARIPAAAVAGIAPGEAAVFRIEDGHAFRVVLSETRTAGDGFLLARGQIAPGDALIVSGHDNIANGGVVEVVQ